MGMEDLQLIWSKNVFSYFFPLCSAKLNFNCYGEICTNNSVKCAATV